MGLRARADTRAGAADPRGPGDARGPAQLASGVGRDGRRRAEGRPAREPELSRVRARERNRVPHLQRVGARSVRRAVSRVPAGAHAEGAAGRAPHLAQGRVPRDDAVSTTAAARLRRADARPVVGALVLAAGAWALTADRMAGMDGGPGAELGGLGWFAVTWLVMMAAMMLPALTPMVVAYSCRARSATGSVAFGAGYLAAWLL